MNLPHTNLTTLTRADAQGQPPRERKPIDRAIVRKAFEDLLGEEAKDHRVDEVTDGIFGFVTPGPTFVDDRDLDRMLDALQDERKIEQTNIGFALATWFLICAPRVTSSAILLAGADSGFDGSLKCSVVMCSGILVACGCRHRILP